jgi:hypothetical protein
MREERVTLTNIEVSLLYDSTKQYLENLKFDIIHEDNIDNYWSLKAHKGGKINTITGSIRDVEIMISGSENNYDLILRTGAWGRDIFVPAALAAVVTGWIGAAAVAGAEVYRAYTFEKNFWRWLNTTVNALGKGNASISEPVLVGASEKK